MSRQFLSPLLRGRVCVALTRLPSHIVYCQHERKLISSWGPGFALVCRISARLRWSRSGFVRSALYVFGAFRALGVREFKAPLPDLTEGYEIEHYARLTPHSPFAETTGVGSRDTCLEAECPQKMGASGSKFRHFDFQSYGVDTRAKFAGRAF